MPFTFTRHTDGPTSTILAAHVNELQVGAEAISYGVYNVREYGVVGNNAADERANMATADAACAAAGGVLYFPPSAGYRIGSNITLSSNLMLGPGASLNPVAATTTTLTGRLHLPFMGCFGGAGTVVPGSASVPAVLPEWWGAKGDNATESAPAIQAATAASYAMAFPVPVEFSGSYVVSAQLLNPGVVFRGRGAQRSVIRWNAALSSGAALVGTTIPGIVFQGLTRESAQVHHMAFYGPAYNATPSYGNDPSPAMDGVVAQGKLLLVDCYINGFVRGLLNNNGPTGGQTGHLTMRGGRINSCKYNYYVVTDGGDTCFYDVDLTGANMASIGITGLYQAGSGFLQNVIADHVHCGFAPFGIFQEAAGTGAGNLGPSGAFMVGNDFRAVEFESIGNSAMATLIPSAQTGNNKFEDVGFGWNPATRLASQPSDYVCVLGNLIGYSHYRPAVNPFTRPPDGVGLGTRGTQGKRGVWYFNNLGGGFKKQIVQNEPDYVAGTSGIGNIDIDVAGLTIGGTTGWASGAVAGTASVLATSSGYYLGPASGLVPTVSLQGQSYPGVTNGGLGVGTVSSACVGPVASGPTATVGAAGNVNAGAHQYYVVHRSNLGGTNVGHTDSGPGSAVITPGVASQVTLTNIPQGSSDVSAIEIYRTVAGNGGNPLLLVSLAPGTLTYTDNTADASLGAAVVHSDTSTGTQFLVYLTGSGTSSGQILFNWKLT